MHASLAGPVDSVDEGFMGCNSRQAVHYRLTLTVVHGITQLQTYGLRYKERFFKHLQWAVGFSLSRIELRKRYQKALSYSTCALKLFRLSELGGTLLRQLSQLSKGREV
jgi:hypothetical protein